jgi:hypothetical protein
VGSRLGTHAIWTLTLSAAISLLALSPIVLPSGTPLEPLPGPLAGVERIGRVVASALLPHRENGEQPQGQATTPAPAGAVEASAPQTASEGGSGVLAERTGGERARPRQPGRDQPTRPEQRPPSVAPRPGGERTLDKAEAKAERHAEKAESKAERKDEKKDKKDKKEHGPDGGKKSHPAHGKGGKNHS